MDLHFILLINLCFWKSLAIEYNTKAGPVEGKMHVYLVPRMHDNVGWPKTIDQYFVGSNSSLQVATIKYILDLFISSLQENPNCKFIFLKVVEATKKRGKKGKLLEILLNLANLNLNGR